MRRVGTHHFVGIAVLSSFFFTIHLAHAACPAFSDVHALLSQQAYDQNMHATVGEQASKHQVPICYRRPSEPSQENQQNNFSAKPQEVKNKSSTLPQIRGMIPCSGFDGKQGDRVRNTTFYKKKDWITEGVPFSELIIALEDSPKAQQDTKFTRKLLKKKEGNYSCQEVTLGSNKNLVLTYSESDQSVMEFSPRNTNKTKVRVLYRKNAPLTADTDLAMVGVPKREKKPTVIYDQHRGFRFRSTDRIINDLNQSWQKKSGNTNLPFQHGDESLFGLSPINDIFDCFDTNGKHQAFDLTKAQKKRKEALVHYGKWLKLQSKHAEIPIPNEEFIKKRNSYLKQKFGFTLPYEESLEDYKLLASIVYPEKEKAFHLSTDYERVSEKIPRPEKPQAEPCRFPPPTEQQPSCPARSPSQTRFREFSQNTSNILRTQIGSFCFSQPESCGHLEKTLQKAPLTEEQIARVFDFLRSSDPVEGCFFTRNLVSTDPKTSTPFLDWIKCESN